MKKTKAQFSEAKWEFHKALKHFVDSLKESISTENGEWTVKGFIDVYKNIYTLNSDTKIISKILEIHLFPDILSFAERIGYSIVLAEQQNWYPDLSFVNLKNPDIKFAVDLKTTYRDPEYPGHVNGFTLGSHGEYFRNRTSGKNIQFSYAQYAGHFCLGIIYTRLKDKSVGETKTYQVQELGEYESGKQKVSLPVTAISSLRSIASIVKDFQFFVCEKWQLASDRQGSGNTANIGSITCIEDILKGHSVFSKLGEAVFDEYWMNYGVTTMLRDGKDIPIRKLEDFLEFKGIDKSKKVPQKSKKKIKEASQPCEP